MTDTKGPSMDTAVFTDPKVEQLAVHLAEQHGNEVPDVLRAQSLDYVMGYHDGRHDRIEADEMGVRHGLDHDHDFHD